MMMIVSIISELWLVWHYTDPTPSKNNVIKPVFLEGPNIIESQVFMCLFILKPNFQAKNKIRSSGHQHSMERKYYQEKEGATGPGPPGPTHPGTCCTKLDKVYLSH